MIAASKRCGPPQTFSHTLKSKYFAVSKWREAQTYEVSQPTFDSINSPASLLCQFTYCFVCKICMIFCQPDLRYKQNKLAKIYVVIILRAVCKPTEEYLDFRTNNA